MNENNFATNIGKIAEMWLTADWRIEIDGNGIDVTKHGDEIGDFICIKFDFEKHTYGWLFKGFDEEMSMGEHKMIHTTCELLGWLE